MACPVLIRGLCHTGFSPRTSPFPPPPTPPLASSHGILPIPLPNFCLIIHSSRLPLFLSRAEKYFHCTIPGASNTEPAHLTRFLLLSIFPCVKYSQPPLLSVVHRSCLLRDASFPDYNFNVSSGVFSRNERRPDACCSSSRGVNIWGQLQSVAAKCRLAAPGMSPFAQLFATLSIYSAKASLQCILVSPDRP